MAHSSRCTPSSRMANTAANAFVSIRGVAQRLQAVYGPFDDDLERLARLMINKSLAVRLQEGDAEGGDEG